MKVHQIKNDWYPGEMKVNTYVVEFDDFCIVVDAQAPLRSVRELTNKPIKAVFITHGHHDHIMSIEEYDELDVPIYANEHIVEMLNDPVKNVSNLVGSPTIYRIKHLNKMYEDYMIMVGGNAIYAYYTPGHSIDSMSYLVDDTLFTGDTLFSIAVGRVDLPTGSPEELIESLNKLKTLKFEDAYCGHGRKTNRAEQTTNIYKWQNYLKNEIKANQNV